MVTSRRALNAALVLDDTCDLTTHEVEAPWSFTFRLPCTANRTQHRALALRPGALASNLPNMGGLRHGPLSPFYCPSLPKREKPPWTTS